MNYNVKVWSRDPVREVLFRDHGIRMREECMIFPSARSNRIEVGPCTVVREVDVPRKAMSRRKEIRYMTRLGLQPFAGTPGGRREVLRMARELARRYMGVVEIGEGDFF